MTAVQVYQEFLKLIFGHHVDHWRVCVRDRESGTLYEVSKVVLSETSYQGGEIVVELVTK